MKLMKSAWFVGIFVALVCGSVADFAATASDGLVCAGNQEHFWFAAEPGTWPGSQQAATKPAAPKVAGYELYHHATDLGGPYFKPQNWLARQPLAMASWGNRVWVVFPVKPDAPEPRLEVFSIEVQKNPALDVYMSVPSGRLDIEAPLPGNANVASFVGTAQGPVALIFPNVPGASPQLLALQQGQWSEIALPAGFSGASTSRLAAGGHSGSNLVLIGPDPASAAQSLRFDRQANGDWKPSTLQLDASRIHSMVNVDGRIAIVMNGPGKSIELAYLRPSGLASLASLAAPANTWSILGFGGALQLVYRSFDGAIELQPIGSLRGNLGPIRRLQPQPLTTGKLWQVSMLVAISISGLLLVFLIKPVSKAPVTLPEGTSPLPASMRLGALLLDLLPSGVLVGLLMRASMTELVKAPVLTIDLQQSLPFLLMAAVTVVHCTVTETIKGTTLGKALVGARVVAVNGERPRPRQILLRNGLKCLILIVPPLAVFALINPHLQGLPDIAAGTVVVYERDESPEQKAEDR